MEKKIGILITGATAFFLCAGYIYSKGYYSTFGIRVEDYFEITDYIKGSIDEIVWFAIFLGLGFGWAYLEKVVRVKKMSIIWYWIFFVFFSITAVVGFISDNPARYLFLFILLFLAIILLDEFMVGRLESYKEIRRYIWSFLLVLFCSTLIYVNGKTTALVEMQAGYQPNRATRIITNNKVIEELSDLLFLGSNSRYGFFYDKTTNESVVIPLERIKYFKISPIKKETATRQKD